MLCSSLLTFLFWKVYALFMLFHLCIHLRILIDKAIFITDDLVPLTNNITGTTSEASTGDPSGALELIPEFLVRCVFFNLQDFGPLFYR